MPTNYKPTQDYEIALVNIILTLKMRLEPHGIPLMTTQDSQHTVTCVSRGSSPVYLEVHYPVEAQHVVLPERAIRDPLLRGETVDQLQDFERLFYLMMTTVVLDPNIKRVEAWRAIMNRLSPHLDSCVHAIVERARGNRGDLDRTRRQMLQLRRRLQPRH